MTRQAMFRPLKVRGNKTTRAGDEGKKAKSSNYQMTTNQKERELQTVKSTRTQNNKAAGDERKKAQSSKDQTRKPDSKQSSDPQST